MILNLLYINLIISYIFYSGFPVEIQSTIISILTKGKVKNGMFKFQKPFFCSVCLTFWISIAYIIITNNISLLSILLSCLSSYLSPIVESIYRLLADMIVKFLNLLNITILK